MEQALTLVDVIEIDCGPGGHRERPAFGNANSPETNIGIFVTLDKAKSERKQQTGYQKLITETNQVWRNSGSNANQRPAHE